MGILQPRMTCIQNGFSIEAEYRRVISFMMQQCIETKPVQEAWRGSGLMGPLKRDLEGLCRVRC